MHWAFYVGVGTPTAKTLTSIHGILLSYQAITGFTQALLAQLSPEKQE
jgi:hypothetical protein